MIALDKVWLKRLLPLVPVALLALQVSDADANALDSGSGTQNTGGNNNNSNSNAQNQDFDSIATLLVSWLEGSLGRVLGVATLLVGLAIGVVKQSIMAAVTGGAMALAAAFGPSVIETIFTSGLAITQAI